MVFSPSLTQIFMFLQSSEAQNLGVDFYSSFETSKFLSDLDVLVLAVPLIEFEETVQTIPAASLRGKLVVEMCVMNAHPKAVLLRAYGDVPDIDIIASHPMLGPALWAGSSTNVGTSSSNKGNAAAGVVIAKEEDPYAALSSGWDGRPVVYEKVRVNNVPRCEKFLKIFEEARCQMVEMEAELHDASIADAEFVTHLTGRLLVDRHLLPPTPVISKEYAALCDVADMTGGDSFDLFFGMFKFNDRAKDHIQKMRENLSTLERQLAAKEAYLAASIELKNSDRQRLLAETKLLLREVAKNGGLLVEEKKFSPDKQTSDST